MKLIAYHKNSSTVKWGSQSIIVFCSYSEQLGFLVFCCRPYSRLLSKHYRPAVWAAVRLCAGREAVLASIAEIVVHFVVTSRMSPKGMIVGSSLPMSFFIPVDIFSSLYTPSTLSTFPVISS